MGIGRNFSDDKETITIKFRNQTTSNFKNCAHQKVLLKKIPKVYFTNIDKNLS